MDKCAFIYNYYMYRCHGSIFMSMFTISFYMCDMPEARCAVAVLHGYVVIAKLQTNLCHCSYPILSLKALSNL